MKITLCGSTRFAELFRQVNEELSCMGHVVYALGVMPPRTDLPPLDKETLDLVHLYKIMESDVVVWVTDDTNYIGDSTRREFKWAKMLGKPIRRCSAIGTMSHPLREYPLNETPSYPLR